MEKLDIVDIDIMMSIVTRELEKMIERGEDEEDITELKLLKEKLERTQRGGKGAELDIKEIGFITMLTDDRLTKLENGEQKILSEQFYFELRMLRRKLRVITKENVRKNACNV